MAIGILLLSLLPLFVFKLSQSSLYSFDEAWYAEVAKQIISTGNYWVMHFNNQVFTDHPPVGFWIISFFQRMVGINEMGSRIGVAMFGVLGLLGIYLLGKEWFGKLVGFMGALALASAPWYVFRARSGNLDILLTTGMLWVIYLAWKAREDRRYFWVSVGLLTVVLLIKTAAPFALFPALLIIFWKSKVVSKKNLVFGLIIALGVYGYWVTTNMKASSIFVTKYLMVAAPGSEDKQNYWNNLLQVKTFVHHGIGNWFRPSVLALAICCLLGLRKRKYLVIAVMTASILGPMVLSERARLWHMIPVYPFMLLGLFGVLDNALKWLPKRMGAILIIVWGLSVAVPQIQKNWYEFVDVNANVSDEQILSEKAGGYKERLYIGENFLPSAVFYANKQVERMYGSVDELFQSADSNYLLIAKQQQLDDIKSDNTKYEILGKDRDKVLIRFDKY